MFRSNYLKGIPLEYQDEEDIEGITTYLFTYLGRGEYTESYSGTEQYPGIPVKVAQEIKCADDQLVFRVWVEPLTGEILKMMESCLSGDYIYDIASGQKITAVLRWAGTTGGDDVLIRANQIRAERARLQWFEVYLPAITALIGIILLVGEGVKRSSVRSRYMKRFFISITTRTLAGQAIGFIFAAVIGLTVLYFGIRAQVYDTIRTSGLAAVEMLEDVLKQDPDLMKTGSMSHRESLDLAIDEFTANFSSISRMSVVNSHLYVVADSELQTGVVTDQTALIETMQNPVEDSVPFLFTRFDQRYMRLSQVIHGQYNTARDSEVIGAMSIDLSLSEAEMRINAIFIQAAGALIILFTLQIGMQYLFLYNSVLNPIRVLINAAQQIERGQLDARASINVTGELGDLERAFNNMADEIKRTNITLRENSQALRNIIQTSPLAMIQMDADRIINMWNPAAERIFGWSEAEALGRHLQTIPPDKADETSALFESQLQGKSLTRVNSQWLRKDGTLVDVSISAVALHDLAGNLTGFSSIINDISELKQAEDAMKVSNDTLSLSVAKLEQRTRELTQLGEMGDLLLACVLPEEANLVIARALGKIFPNMSGTLYEVPPSRDQMKPVMTWGAFITEASTFAMDGCWALRRGGTHRVEDSVASLICQHVADEGGKAFPYLCVPMMAHHEALGILHLRCSAGSAAITQENQQLAETVAEQIALMLSNLKLREALRQQSIRDTLTGLFNRRYMDETLTREIGRARRGKIPVSIIMMDIDHFKQFNDTYGHEAGDMVLKSIGKLLQTEVRADDIACRYGGEEFTLILPGASRKIAQQRAEQLRDGIHALEINYKGKALGALTLSFGVAVFPTHGESGQAVLKAADTALYQAKQNGRDRVELAG